MQHLHPQLTLHQNFKENPRVINHINREKNTVHGSKMYKPEWEDEIQTAFFKCTKWQLEETLDPDSCPYHYYCNSKYPGDYATSVDVAVIVFMVASFLATVGFMVMDAAGNDSVRRLRRYFLPSGPFCMPAMILVMAKGSRIGGLFSMVSVGPAMLQMLRISAMVFEDETMSDLKYVFLESSSISGILHAALYLDSVVLPFYTGLDALMLSRMSGECRSCVCRDRPLVVGGTLVVFRGWSATTAVVVGGLFMRISCRLWKENNRAAKKVKGVLENLSWVLIGAESVYLVMVPDPRRTWVGAVSYGGVFVLICLQVGRKICTWFMRKNRSRNSRKDEEIL